MGVPGFAVSLYHKYKDKGLIVGYDNRNVDALYLDTNCLIHPVCMRVYNENPNIKDNERLESKMIYAVIEYIEMLIKMTHPKKLVYIAIDGVAPMAKIKHQRIRRFKSAKDFEVKYNIAKKYDRDYPKPWNNSAITPGTVFMKKLTRAILYHLQGKAKSSTHDEKVEYIFSSCNTPSEGEHKILQHIKKHDYGVKMIYGLDADLIYLALACQQSNIFLLRETCEFQRNTSVGFSMVDIECMKRCLQDELGKVVDVDKFIRDYIFMGFFLGNDFIPALPSVNLKFTKESLNGHTILLECYRNLFDGDYLINNKKQININFLLKLLERLTEYEEPYLRQAYRQRISVRPCDSNDPFDQEIYRLENLMFTVPDPIELGKDGVPLEESKERYYKYYHMNKKDAIKQYIEGVQWTLYYYFDKCPDWLWFYPHEAAPFVSDIYEYLKTHVIEKPKFINGYKFIKPLQQLLMVLPQQSKDLLPDKYQRVMANELKEYYPVKYELDFVLKTRFWQGVPQVPMIDPYRVVEVTNDIPLTEEENSRNEFQLEFKTMV